MFRNARSKTKYREEFADQAYKYALLGARTADLARLFDVDESTIKRWAEKNESFAIAVRDGGELADAKVAAALYQRAVGLSRTSRKISIGPKGRTTTTETVYYPPDVSAQAFWLKNRQADLWRDRQEVDHTVRDAPLDFSNLTAEEREALRTTLLEKAQQLEQPTDKSDDKPTGLLN